MKINTKYMSFFEDTHSKKIQFSNKFQTLKSVPVERLIASLWINFLKNSSTSILFKTEKKFKKIPCCSNKLSKRKDYEKKYLKKTKIKRKQKLQK